MADSKRRKYSSTTQINKRSVRAGQKARAKGNREREAMKATLAAQKKRSNKRATGHKADQDVRRKKGKK